MAMYKCGDLELSMNDSHTLVTDWEVEKAVSSVHDKSPHGAHYINVRVFVDGHIHPRDFVEDMRRYAMELGRADRIDREYNREY
tara:strand:+ start:73 stop:324 length:252 start_codon:yes stop_codon:yes gene_type:complete